jgi:hypothetical protein
MRKKIEGKGCYGQNVWCVNVAVVIVFSFGFSVVVHMVSMLSGKVNLRKMDRRNKGIVHHAFDYEKKLKKKVDVLPF